MTASQPTFQEVYFQPDPFVPEELYLLGAVVERPGAQPRFVMSWQANPDLIEDPQIRLGLKRLRMRLYQISVQGYEPVQEIGPYIVMGEQKPVPGEVEAPLAWARAVLESREKK